MATAEDIRQEMVQNAMDSLVSDSLSSGLDVSNNNHTVNAKNCDISNRTMRFSKIKRRVGVLLGMCEIPFRSRGDIGVQIGKVLDAYEKIEILTCEIFKIIRDYNILTHETTSNSVEIELEPCQSSVECKSRFASSLKRYSKLPEFVRTKLIKCIMARYASTVVANRVLGEVEKRIEIHVSARRKRNYSWLSTDKIGIDILGKVTEFVDFRSAAACTRSCSELRNLENLRVLLPHLSIRWIPGEFPHVIAPSTDTAYCGFISRKTLVHVYTDLIVTGTRRDDPDSIMLQTTPSENEQEEPIYMSRVERINIRNDMHSRAKRHTTDGIEDTTRFRRRLGHEAFFSTPIKCSYDLVFADTHEIVQSTLGHSAICLSKSMRKPSAPIHTYTSLNGVPYPSRVSFYVEDLSVHHANRKFKVRVCGRATTLYSKKAHTYSDSSIYTQKLIGYSKQFEIVSTKKVPRRFTFATASNSRL